MLPETLIKPEIVGRESELQQLQESLKSACQGNGRTIFISGEAGAGKTTLVTEFLKTAKKDNAIILSGRCLSNAAVPYFPFFEAFSAFFDSKNLHTDSLGDSASIGNEVIGWLMGPTNQRSEGHVLSAQSWKDQTFTSVMKTLSLISEKKPVILFIEDLQWADSASLILLHYLARLAEQAKILILATYRSEEVISDTEGRSSLLLETLRLMGREELSGEIKLQNLDLQLVSKLAAKMLGGSVSSTFADTLSKESAGNPLFIVESIRMLSERKNLAIENGEWRLTVDTVRIPNKIKEIILRRLGWLKNSQRRVLDVASVIGEQFDVDLVSEVLNQDVLEVLDTLNVVAQSTSLVLIEGDAYRFDHAKSREAIYEEIPTPLRKAYHSRIAQKLEEKQQGTQPLADIAHHYAQAGNKEKALEFAFLAGQDALARWSNQEAINHFKYVVNSVSEDRKKDEVFRAAYEALGDAFYANCTFEEAYKIFIDLARSGVGKAQLRAYRKAIDSKFRKAEYRTLYALVKEAEQYVGSDRLESGRLIWSKGRAEAYSDRFLDCLEHHLEALKIFEEEYSLPDVAQVLCGTASTYSYLENSEKALELVLRSIALFRELKDLEGELNAGQIEATSFAFAGLGPESRQRWFSVLELSKKIGHYMYMSFAYFAIANGYETVENFPEAVANSLKVVESSKKTDNKFYLISAYGSLARQYTRIGDLEKANHYLNELIKAGSNIGLGLWFDFYCEASRGAIESVKENWEEANEHFKKALELVKCIGNSAVWDRRIRRYYIWSLRRQGKISEAETQLGIINDRFDKITEKFSAPLVKASIMAKRTVNFGEELEIRLDLVNVSRTPASAAAIKDLNLNDFKIVFSPTTCSLDKGLVNVSNGNIEPFEVNTTKISLKATKLGTFLLNPHGTFLDPAGEVKTFEFQPITVKVAPRKEDELTGSEQKIAFGYAQLDNLLAGGIPEGYSIALVAPPSNEEETLRKKFLETGLEEVQSTLYLTSDIATTRKLASNLDNNLLAIVCNSQAETALQNTKNVTKLKGVENLTEIDIALTRVVRNINEESNLPKRACVDILSDVLLRHHAVTARKWLSALLAALKSKGFTTLAVVNPQMHPSEETQAILSLFDGEIELTEKSTYKILKVRRLSGQTLKDYELQMT